MFQCHSHPIMWFGWQCLSLGHRTSGRLHIRPIVVQHRRRRRFRYHRWRSIHHRSPVHVHTCSGGIWCHQTSPSLCILCQRHLSCHHGSPEVWKIQIFVSKLIHKCPTVLHHFQRLIKTTIQVERCLIMTSLRWEIIKIPFLDDYFDKVF